MESQSTDEPSFYVDQIDHVEVEVPDRYQAAIWYRQTLGLVVPEELEHWAEDPAGPLMIATRHGNTKLALFQGQPDGSRRGTGFHLVAFRVGADAFLKFIQRLPAMELTDVQGRALSLRSVTDHGRAISIYFADPYGNQLELTTYDHQAAREKLIRIGALDPD